jgi:hypothetical protein
MDKKSIKRVFLVALLIVSGFVVSYADSIQNVTFTIYPLGGRLAVLNVNVTSGDVLYLGCTFIDSRGNEVDLEAVEVRSSTTIQFVIPDDRAQEVIFSLWGKKLTRRDVSLRRGDSNYNRLRQWGYLLDDQRDTTGWISTRGATGW